MMIDFVSFNKSGAPSCNKGVPSFNTKLPSEISHVPKSTEITVSCKLEYSTVTVVSSAIALNEVIEKKTNNKTITFLIIKFLLM